MTRLISALAAVLLFVAPRLAHAADVSGRWQAHGRVLIFSFTIDCELKQAGERLGGICYDGGTRKAHVISSGSVLGDKIRWVYPSSYHDKPFDAVYAGVVEGDAMRGAVEASGRSGTFTAVRK